MQYVLLPIVTNPSLVITFILNDTICIYGNNEFNFFTHNNLILQGRGDV